MISIADAEMLPDMIFSYHAGGSALLAYGVSRCMYLHPLRSFIIDPSFLYPSHFVWPFASVVAFARRCVVCAERHHQQPGRTGVARGGASSDGPARRPTRQHAADRAVHAVAGELSTFRPLTIPFGLCIICWLLAAHLIGSLALWIFFGVS